MYRNYFEANRKNIILNYSAQVFIHTENYCHSVSAVKIIGMLRGISKAKSIRSEVRGSSALGYVLTSNYSIKMISDSFPLFPSLSWWGWLYTKLLKVKNQRVTLTISDFMSISGGVQKIDLKDWCQDVCKIPALCAI